MEEEKNKTTLKEEYIKGFEKALKELNNQKEYIFDDMFDKHIKGVEIKIDIQPFIIDYSINKVYTSWDKYEKEKEGK